MLDSAHIRRRRPLVPTLVALVALVAFASLALAGSASAAVTASTITSPANDSAYLIDASNRGSSTTVFTVSGTATGTGSVDIDCYTPYGQYTLASSVAVTGGSFSQAISYADLQDDGTCVLRAVDAGDATAYPPGATTGFAGPTVGISGVYPESSTVGGSPFLWGFEVDANGTAGTSEIYSAQTGGLEIGEVFGDSTFTYSDSLFVQNGPIVTDAATYDYGFQDGTAYPTPLAVDGTEAYLPDAIHDSLTGAQQLTLTDSLSDGILTIHDDEPLSFCEPSPSSCTSMQSAGVELDRTWQMEDQGLVFVESDEFVSTDGDAHTVTALYNQAFAAGPDGAAVDFPGTSGFSSAYTAEQVVSLPSGAGSIYLKYDADTPDTGDPNQQYPQGAIVYGQAPSNVTFLEDATYASGVHHGTAFYMPYTFTVPAGGGTTLQIAYVQDFALADVQSLAQQVLASWGETSSSAPAGGNTGSGGGTATGSSGTATSSSGGAVSSGSPSSSKPAPKSLGTKVKPETAKKFPYHYAVTGKLELPTGVTTKQGCTGKITLTVERGKKKILTATAMIGAKCSWSAKLVLKKRKLVPGHHGKLTLTAAFAGNTALEKYTGKPQTIKYG